MKFLFSMAVVSIFATPTVAQSFQQAPCLLNPDDPACTACLDDPSLNQELQGLVCFGGQDPNKSRIATNSIANVCSMNVCSSNLDDYRACINTADVYLSSGARDHLESRKDELASFDLSLAQVCQPGALPALVAESQELLAVYSVFDTNTRVRWDACLDAIASDYQKISDQGILEDSSEGYGTREVMNSWQVLDQIPSIRGSFDVRGTFTIGGSLQIITSAIAQDSRACAR